MKFVLDLNQTKLSDSPIIDLINENHSLYPIFSNILFMVELNIAISNSTDFHSFIEDFKVNINRNYRNNKSGKEIVSSISNIIEIKLLRRFLKLHSFHL